MTRQAKYVELSHEEAATMLKMNTSNRHINQATVDKYTRDMREGNWGSSDSAVVVDKNGVLINGQHRLLAQVKSETTQTWLVVTGADPEDMDHMDSALPRSMADTLHLHGVENSQLVAAIARLVVLIEKDKLNAGGAYKTSKQEILDAHRRHPVISVSARVALQTRAGMTPLRPAVLGAGHWYIVQTNGVDDATEFLFRVSSLANESEGSPVLALSRRINEAKRQRSPIAIKDQLAMLIRAYNADAKGRTMKTMPIASRTGHFALPTVVKKTQEEETGE